MTLDLEELNARWAASSAEDIIREAHRKLHAGLVMSSHFGRESALLLHMVTQVVPDIPVVYIADESTRGFARELEQRLKLNLHIYHTSAPVDKLGALQQALRQLHAGAVLHGIRAYQSKRRAQKRLVERGIDGFYRIHPVLQWTPQEVEEYLNRHHLPRHPDMPSKSQRIDCELQCFTVVE